MILCSSCINFSKCSTCGECCECVLDEEICPNDECIGDDCNCYEDCNYCKIDEK